MALLSQTMPPTIKSEQPLDVMRRLKPVLNEARPAKDLVWAGNSSFGFGGSDEVTVVTLPGVVLQFRPRRRPTVLAA